MGAQLHIHTGQNPALLYTVPSLHLNALVPLSSKNSPSSNTHSNNDWWVTKPSGKCHFLFHSGVSKCACVWWRENEWISYKLRKIINFCLTDIKYKIFYICKSQPRRKYFPFRLSTVWTGFLMIWFQHYFSYFD